MLTRREEKEKEKKKIARGSKFFRNLNNPIIDNVELFIRG